AKTKPSVGWAPIGRTKYPESERPEDVQAARTLMMSVVARDFWNNTWFADPVVFGAYPEDGIRTYAVPMAFVQAGDLETIRQPLEFYGVNIYDGEPVEAAPDGSPRVVNFAPGHPQTAVRWFITPPALYWGPRFLYERYKLPIVITENGMSG